MAGLFDEMLRTDIGYMQRLQPDFDYLNRSARPELAEVRRFLDEMFARYPASHAAQLRERIREYNNTKHTSAVFELLVHEVLLRGGCKIIAVEPAVEGTQKNPDFLAATADGHEFYVEVTVARGTSELEVGAKRRFDEIISWVDAIQSPDYFLSVRWSGSPERQPSRQSVVQPIERWLAGLSYEAVIACYKRGETLPECLVTVAGLQMRIEPFPRSNTRGIAGQRAIGAESPEASWIQPHEAIKRSLARKASRYGALGLPYVVAVNSLMLASDHEHAVDALFGTIGIAVAFHDDQEVYREVRNRDGFWFGPHGAQNRRVSGVMVTHQLHAWNLSHRSIALMENPHAEHPFFEDVLGELREAVRPSVGEFFGLPKHWPE